MIVSISHRLDQFFQALDDVCRHCGRTPDDITLVLATKYLDAPSLRELLKIIKQHPSRSICIGENRVQDAQRKFRSFTSREDLYAVHPRGARRRSQIKKIFIGTLQKNKVNNAIGLFDEIHSIDSLELAECIDERLRLIGKRMPVFLQVNVSGEAKKHGIPLNESDKAIELLSPPSRLLRAPSPKRLWRVGDQSGYGGRVKLRRINNQAMKQSSNFRHTDLQGLMTMAPLTSDKTVIRSVFRSLRQLADRYGLKTSMGMSNDWKIAIEEGSDMIRIGSAIFC